MTGLLWKELKQKKTIFIEKLAKAYGLKGMPRKDSDNSERARKAIFQSYQGQPD